MADAMDDYDEGEVDDWTPKSKKKNKGTYALNKSRHILFTKEV